MCKVRKVADDIMNGYLNNKNILGVIKSMDTIYELRYCTVSGRVRKEDTSPYATSPCIRSLFQRKLKLRINSFNLLVIA